MLFIKTQQELNSVCKLLEQEKILAIDTEFVRRTSYFPRLSLIQIVTPKLELIIDYLAGIDLAPLNQILQNANIIKILHSCSQDLEIFYHIFQELPKNIFDTQISANICGYGEAMSYSFLCERFLSVKIDKTHQAANWLQRPLKPAMIEYAINDVRYLIPLYQQLNNIIFERKLQTQLQQKILSALDPINYQPDLTQVWKKVKFRKYNAKFIKKMQVLAGYREECAKSADIARRLFASDKDLIRLCTTLPTKDQDLKNLSLEKHYITSALYKMQLFKICEELREAEKS